MEETSILDEIKKLKKLDLESLLTRRKKAETESESGNDSESEKEKNPPKKKQKKKKSVLDLINS